MKHILLILLSLAIPLVAWLKGPHGPPMPPIDVQVIEGSYIFSMHTDTTEEELLGAQARLEEFMGKEHISYVYNFGTYKGFAVVDLWDDDALDILVRWSIWVGVEPDIVMRGYQFPSDLGHPFQISLRVPWNLNRICHRERRLRKQLVYAYPTSAGNHSIIYHLDTGVNEKHHDFSWIRQVSQGVNLVRGADAIDGAGHGTFLADIAVGTNYGIAKRAQLVGVKVLGMDNEGWMSDVIAGLQWAVDDMNNRQMRGYAIALLALGSRTHKRAYAMNAAVRGAADAGLFVVAAAGNDALPASEYIPAGEAAALTVGAMTDSDELAYFSNVGPSVDMFAPGYKVYGAWIGGTRLPKYNWNMKYFSGTSVAAAHAAGVAAIVMSVEGAREPHELRKRMIDLATKGMLSSKIPHDEGTPNVLLNTGVPWGIWESLKGSRYPPKPIHKGKDKGKGKGKGKGKAKGKGGKLLERESEVEGVVEKEDTEMLQEGEEVDMLEDAEELQLGPLDEEEEFELPYNRTAMKMLHGGDVLRRDDGEICLPRTPEDLNLQNLDSKFLKDYYKTFEHSEDHEYYGDDEDDDDNYMLSYSHLLMR